MARVSKVETCMFCGEVPCICNAVVPRPKAAPKPKPAVVAPVEPAVEPTASPIERPSMLAAMAATVAAQTEVATPFRSHDKPIRGRRIRDQMDAIVEVAKPTITVRAKTVDEVLFEDAVRNLAPLLHPDERATYSLLISGEHNPEQRAVVWKARREAGNAKEA